jgi:DNA uptake protein ComE-like DNA-binding protein
MKLSLLKSVLASGLFLAAGLAMAQDSQPETPKPVRSRTAAGRAEKAKAKAKPAVNQVDLNRASKEDLKKLPGITDALADKIIAGRPYLTKSRLVTQKVVSDGIYLGIKDKVTAGYVAPAKKP